jgi:hypothetical protein
MSRRRVGVNRRRFIKGAAAGLGLTATGWCKMGAAQQAPGYVLKLESARSGFDGETCWVHARGGAIPGGGQDGKPAAVVTMQKLLLSGSDVFYGLHEMRTDNLGVTWSGPTPMPTFARWEEADGVEACVCDFTLKWHTATRALLGTGHVARYGNNRILEVRPNQPSYAVYDAGNRTWSRPAFVALPSEPKFHTAGSGSGQRCDLVDGTVLLPIYFRPDPKVAMYQATVARCRFDGRTLEYVEHGDELAAPDPRGMCEPSIAAHGGRFYLTLRNDVRGYVTVGDDGLHYRPPVPWRFDDGEELGNYNTQQHWVAHTQGLFLVYTRRGANNDRVFRHRAPLFMGAVDPERLCVIRDTERVVVPERGARLGNFGVCEVSGEETWVIASEWMQPVGCEKYGSDNTLWIARLVWDQPNR